MIYNKHTVEETGAPSSHSVGSRAGILGVLLLPLVVHEAQPASPDPGLESSRGGAL